MPTILDRFKSGWNAFMGRDPTIGRVDYGYGSYHRPDQSTKLYVGDRSIIRNISNRIAVDVARVTIEHVKIDSETGYQDTVNSQLNERLNLSANIDQTGRAFIQDVVMSMFDEGVVAVVPTDLDFPANIRKNPEDTESFDILAVRTGKILEWYPQHVKVRVYNERTGRQEDIVVSKSYTAIIENPLYAIVNEPNSTLQRLKRTLNDLDAANKNNTSGKLDMIIQYPYQIKSEERLRQAEHRKKQVEEQLTGSKYGIAYIDGTEKIVQLNRPLDNSLWQQAEALEQKVYNELGLTKEVFEGTANEAVMVNYENRTIEPIASAICDELKRKFLSKNARTRGETIIYYRDPFKLVPTSQLATIADTFIRNEILTPNEIRTKLGYKPSKDPKSDELRNRNINISDAQIQNEQMMPEEETVEGMPPEEQQMEEEQLTKQAPQNNKLTMDEIMSLLNGGR